MGCCVSTEIGSTAGATTTTISRCPHTSVETTTFYIIQQTPAAPIEQHNDTATRSSARAPTADATIMPPSTEEREVRSAIGTLANSDPPISTTQRRGRLSRTWSPNAAASRNADAQVATVGAMVRTPLHHDNDDVTTNGLALEAPRVAHHHQSESNTHELLVNTSNPSAVVASAAAEVAPIAAQARQGDERCATALSCNDNHDACIVSPFIAASSDGAAKRTLPRVRIAQWNGIEEGEMICNLLEHKKHRQQKAKPRARQFRASNPRTLPPLVSEITGMACRL